MIASCLARLLAAILAFASVAGRAHASDDFKFDGPIPEQTLRNYLGRSMTLMYLLTSHGDLDDNIRMMTNCGVKFAGRSIYQWGREEGGESAIPAKLERAKTNAAKIHAADPEIILQACVFEIISRDVTNLTIPKWVFEAFKLPVEDRKFRFEDILYASGRGATQWGGGAGVPDVSRPETKMWFYYAAASYIDIGCEAIHFGQAELMNKNDPNLDHWAEILSMVHEYGRKHARRHWVICDAHVPGGGLVREGKLLLDVHAFPLRIEEIPERPHEAQLRVGFVDGIYGRSKGGIAPAGWKCAHLPALVEFDNYGRSRKPGEAGQGRFWIWGWDEITWFAQQTPEYRNQWLRYASDWLRKNDPDAYLEMPGARVISGGPDGKRWYEVNEPSSATPNGFGQEKAIKAIWAGKPN